MKGTLCIFNARDSQPLFTFHVGSGYQNIGHSPREVDPLIISNSPDIELLPRSSSNIALDI